jgi:single-strand DNA-binding protein
MNKCIITGRLTKDIEVKTTSNDKEYCSFTIAVDRRFKDADGNRQADFISCTAWNKTAEFLGKYFHKGSRIGICGSIQTRSYEKDGQKVFVTEVLVEEAEFLDSKTDSQPQPQPKAQVQEQAEEMESIGKLPFEL